MLALAGREAAALMSIGRGSATSLIGGVTNAWLFLTRTTDAPPA